MILPGRTRPRTARPRTPGTKLPTDDLEVVAASVGLPLRISNEPASAVYEQTVEFAVATPGSMLPRCLPWGVNTWTPPGPVANRFPLASTFMPSGSPGFFSLSPSGHHRFSHLAGKWFAELGHILQYAVHAEFAR